jgi:hypothetical protein
MKPLTTDKNEIFSQHTKITQAAFPSIHLAATHVLYKMQKNDIAS